MRSRRWKQLSKNEITDRKMVKWFLTLVGGKGD